MPRNGSGAYTLPPGINPVVTQTLITSNWANTTLSDVAAALTQSLTRDGQTVPTADLPMGGFKHLNVGNPALRNQYATLDFVQDGDHFRVANVTGVNQIVATLVGGATSLTVGQIIQLIPTSNNTGAVTIDINGIGPKPVRTEIGSDLGAGNLIAGRPYLISYNGSEFTMLAGGGGSGIAQSAMSGWDRPTPTGPYPAITQVNPTTVAVPAGTGRIVRPSARDLSGVSEVAWAAQNVTLNFVATAWHTTLGINSAGAVVQFTGNFNPAWARDNILIGTVTHINGVINEINTIPAIFGDMIYASYDIGNLLNQTLISGGRIFPNAVSPFHVDLEAGAVFTLGGDANDINDPNKRDFPAAFDVTFFPVTGNNTVGAATQNVPVTLYDPNGAGTLVAIPGGASTTSIHRMYLLDGEFVFLYGQDTYPDLTTALSQISVDDASVLFPSKLVNAALLGYIVAQKNCLDLKDANTARLLAKGGASFSIGSAGSISDAPINGLTYGRKDASWVEVVPAPKGPQATLRSIFFYTNAFARWSLTANDTPEGGANTGSNYELRAYNDAGTFSGAAYTINRATRQMSIPETLNTAAILSSAGHTISAAGGLDWIGRNTGAIIGNSALASFHGGDAASLQARIAIRAAEAWTGAAKGTNIEFSTTPNGSLVSALRWTMGNDGNFFGPGSIIAGGSVAANNGNFTGAAASVVLAPAVAGSIFFRPNGPASAVGQVTIDSAGTLSVSGAMTVTTDFTAGGTIIAGTFFRSSNNAVVLATSVNPGTVYLRPNGPGIAAGQAILESSGRFNVDFAGVGTVGTTGAFNVSGRSYMAPLSEHYAIGLGFNNARAQASQTVYVGATDSVNPSMVFSDAAGALMATMAPGGIFNTPGAMVSGDSITANTFFVSSNANAVLGSTGAGTVYLRPNGPATGVGETFIGSNGNLVSAGRIVAQGSHFIGGPALGILSPSANAAGSVILRPRGPDDVTNQLLYTAAGQLWSDGAMSIGPSHNNQGFQFAWNTIQPGAGANEYINNYGGGSGGHVWYVRSTPADGPVACMSVTLSALSIAGTGFGINWVASSDERLKEGIKDRKARERLPNLLRFVDFIWRDTGKAGVGLIAQELQKIAPEYVSVGEDEAGTLAIDKAGLALECVIGLAARVKELEEQVHDLTG